MLTAAFWNENVRDNSNELYNTTRRIGFQQRTTSYTTTTTAAPGAANIFGTSISWTADGTSAYLLEAYAPAINTATNAGSFVVVSFTNNAGTSIAQIATSGFGDGTRSHYVGLFARYWYTPSAGTATLNLRAYHGTAAGSIDAGNAGAAQAPMYIAVYGPALT